MDQFYSIFESFSFSGASIWIILAGLVVLVAIGVIAYLAWAGLILVKFPVKVIVWETRKGSLVPKWTTKARLVRKDNKAFYRLRDGFFPWQNVDWVPTPDYKYIDTRDFLNLYSPNRDEYHAIAADLKKQIQVRVLDEGMDGHFDLDLDLGGNQRFFPIKLLPPEGGWEQDMSTAAKAYYGLKQEDIANRSALPNWLERYQPLIMALVIVFGLVLASYLWWTPLADTAADVRAAKQAEQLQAEALERIMEELNITSEDVIPGPPPDVGG